MSSLLPSYRLASYLGYDRRIPWVATQPQSRSVATAGFHGIALVSAMSSLAPTTPTAVPPLRSARANRTGHSRSTSSRTAALQNKMRRPVRVPPPARARTGGGRCRNELPAKRAAHLGPYAVAVDSDDLAHWKGGRCFTDPLLSSPFQGEGPDATAAVCSATAELLDSRATLQMLLLARPGERCHGAVSAPRPSASSRKGAIPLPPDPRRERYVARSAPIAFRKASAGRTTYTPKHRR